MVFVRLGRRRGFNFWVGDCLGDVKVKSKVVYYFPSDEVYLMAISKVCPEYLDSALDNYLKKVGGVDGKNKVRSVLQSSRVH